MKKSLQDNLKVSQEQALEKFMSQIGEINGKLAELQEFADEHMGYHPDDINWGHVGTAGWFLEKLTEITDHTF